MNSINIRIWISITCIRFIETQINDQKRLLKVSYRAGGGRRGGDLRTITALLKVPFHAYGRTKWRAHKRVLKCCFPLINFQCWQSIKRYCLFRKCLYYRIFTNKIIAPTTPCVIGVRDSCIIQLSRCTHWSVLGPVVLKVKEHEFQSRPECGC